MRHRLTVDAYMAQHPGLGTRGGVRSVLTHLVGIHLALDRKMEAPQIGKALAQVFPDKSAAPPEITVVPKLVGVNVEHVTGAKREEHDVRVEEWARFVWSAWSAQHAAVQTLAASALAQSSSRTTR